MNNCAQQLHGTRAEAPESVEGDWCKLIAGAFMMLLVGLVWPLNSIKREAGPILLLHEGTLLLFETPHTSFGLSGLQLTVFRGLLPVSQQPHLGLGPCNPFTHVKDGRHKARTEQIRNLVAGVAASEEASGGLNLWPVESVPHH